MPFSPFTDRQTDRQTDERTDRPIIKDRPNTSITTIYSETTQTIIRIGSCNLTMGPYSAWKYKGDQYIPFPIKYNYIQLFSTVHIFLVSPCTYRNIYSCIFPSSTNFIYLNFPFGLYVHFNLSHIHETITLNI